MLTARDWVGQLGRQLQYDFCFQQVRIAVQTVTSCAVWIRLIEASQLQNGLTTDWVGQPGRQLQHGFRSQQVRRAVQCGLRLIEASCEWLYADGQRLGGQPGRQLQYDFRFQQVRTAVQTVASCALCIRLIKAYQLDMLEARDCVGQPGRQLQYERRFQQVCRLQLHLIACACKHLGGLWISVCGGRRGWIAERPCRAT